MTTNPATRTFVRPLLWVLVVIFGAANVTSSVLDLDIFIGVGFGLLTLASATALAMHHYRNR